MLLRPYLNDAGSCASYIFGCTSHNTLAVVDPHADFVDDYVAAADAIGAPIVAVFETDVQADHVSGLPALLERTGATGYLPAGAGVVWVGAAVIVTEGLLLSIFAVRDTRAHVVLEQQAHAERTAQHAGLRSAFVYATVRDPVLRACSQAGLVNNLNDALAWGLAPLYLAAHGASVREIAIVAAASSPRAAIAVVAALGAASGLVIAGTSWQPRPALRPAAVPR
jgi:hypothetical protein